MAVKAALLPHGTAAGSPTGAARAVLRDRIPVAYFILAGLAILYIPMFIDFGTRFWLNDEDSHSGILLLGIIWAYYTRRAAFTATASSKEFAAGVGVVCLGLAIYTLGRISEFFQLQGLSLLVVVLGLTLASAGIREARRCALINGLLIFTVPLLGPLGDSFLVPLRLHLTAAAADLVSHLGFLVATNGVIVTVGYVQLNIAGACVGLRSMVSLFAIGLLFLHYFPLKGWLPNLLFIALLPVVGLAANFIRIVMLILVAGQYGSTIEMQVHDAAAYTEVIVAVGLFVVLANVFQRWAVSRW